jgi:hypothetical protein
MASSSFIVGMTIATFSVDITLQLLNYLEQLVSGALPYHVVGKREFTGKTLKKTSKRLTVLALMTILGDNIQYSAFLQECHVPGVFCSK